MLESYIDIALQLSGSPFTVGIAEEENNSPVITSTPEPCYKMATASEFRPIMTAVPESAPEAAPSTELAESAPEAAPSTELAESAPEAAPSTELAESAPEAAPSTELAESAPEAAPSTELAESAPEAAPSQELAESALQPVPPSSPSSPLVPPSSPSSPLVPPSSPSPWILSSLALSERPRDPASPECPLTFAPPECPLEVVELPRDFLRPRTRHGPWSPLIHLGCLRPWIYHGHLNSLPRSLRL